MLRFTRDGTVYLVQGVNPIDPAAPPDVRARRQADNDLQSTVRTLRIGNALLMMERIPAAQSQGNDWGYDIDGTTLRAYSIDNSRAVAFLAIKHPRAKNIRSNVGEGAYAVIGTFDDEVFRVLSELAASPSCWRLECEYQKIPSVRRNYFATISMDAVPSALFP